MRQRGRKSAAELEVAQPVELVARPDAPYDLSDEESVEWWGIVNARPADYFPKETHGMLADYCRHVVRSRRVADMIRALEGEVRAETEGDDPKTMAEAILDATRAMDRLYKMADRESRAVSSLATRMRLSQQANIRADAAKPPKTVRKLWD